jgi:hypothetical protein
MLDSLKDRGFEVETLSHAKAILSGDFPEVAAEIETILLASTIPIEEIVGSGGECLGSVREQELDFSVSVRGCSSTHRGTHRGRC